MSSAKVRQEVVNLRTETLQQDLERAREGGGLLRFSGPLGFTNSDVSCIRDATWVRYIEMHDLVDCDLDDIRSLPNLSSIHVNGTFDRSLSMDLSDMVSLRNVTVPSTKSIQLPGAHVPLEALSLSHWNQDLGSLPGWTSLRVLWLFRTRIPSLAGIERFPSLQEVSLDSASRLTSVEQLGALPNLETLILDGCAQMVSLEGLQCCTKLRVVVVRSCRGITSLSPLTSLPELRQVRLIQVPRLASQMVLLRADIERVAFPMPRARGRKSVAAQEKDPRSDAESTSARHHEALPTLAWRERMEAGDDNFTEAGLKASEKRLKAFLEEVEAIPAGSPPLKDAIRKVVEDFNQFSLDHPGFIETMEREELAQFLGLVADSKEFDYEGNDVTEPWRTEW